MERNGETGETGNVGEAGDEGSAGESGTAGVAGSVTNSGSEAFREGGGGDVEMVGFTRRGAEREGLRSAEEADEGRGVEFNAESESEEKQLMEDLSDRGDVGGDAGAEREASGGESVCRRCLGSLSFTRVLKNPTRLRVLPCSTDSFSFSFSFSFSLCDLFEDV